MQISNNIKDLVFSFTKVCFINYKNIKANKYFLETIFGKNKAK